MKLYAVKVEVSAVIAADSVNEAADLADDALRDELDNVLPDLEVWEIEEVGGLPRGWSERTLVYHRGDEDLSVRDVRKQQEQRNG